MADEMMVMPNSSGFNGDGLWVFALLLLLFGGNGGWGRGGEQYATSADVQRGFDTSEITRKLDGLANGICDATYALNNDITNEGRATQNAIADCCCTTQRNIDSVRFDMANYVADIKANDTANTQKVLDVLAQNKIEDLQGKVNNLELQNALAGVVRYPNGFVYNAGTNPFCGCGGYCN